VGGYADDRYMAVFAGVAPASNPRIVTVVMIDEPNLDKYHGGEAAAPVFARVVTDALRILNVAPDKMLPANNLVKSGNRQSLKSKKSQSLVEGRESA
jgi:cell division protein FtsI (penicillin-binding protein 3)